LNQHPLPALIELTRGPLVESIHYGSIAVVDRAGRLLASYGDPQTLTYLRSSSKPVQVLPFVEAGGPARYGLTERELAILCASHSGTDEHVAVVRGIQAKVGLREEQLLCGSHPPYYRPTVEAMLLRGEAPTSIRHNCSGKHTGFLAYALMRDLDPSDYINPEHPIQQTILQAFAEMCGMDSDNVYLGVDGCSAPVFGVPLLNAALAFARLADPTDLIPQRAAACRQITKAMMAHPDMVAGPERFDTLVMQIASGRLFAKAGAEGYQCIGLLPGALGPGSPALGIALKVADGDLGGRAVPLAATETLRQLGALTGEQIAQMPDFGPRPVRNWRKIPVGEARPVFQLSGLPLRW
jgi:L-asparaginase II